MESPPNDFFFPQKRVGDPRARLSSWQPVHAWLQPVRNKVVEFYNLVCDAAGLPFLLALCSATHSNLQQHEKDVTNTLGDHKALAKKLITEPSAAVEATFDIVRKDDVLSGLVHQTNMMALVSLDRVIELLLVELIEAVLAAVPSSLDKNFSYQKYSWKKKKHEPMRPFAKYKPGKALPRLSFEDCFKTLNHMLKAEKDASEKIPLLHAYRNCVVHACGLVDEMYKRATGSSLAVGATLPVSADDLYKLTDAVAEFCLRMLSRADSLASPPKR